MASLPTDLTNLSGLVPLQPVKSDDNEWDIDEILSQVPDPADVCPQIPYIPEPPQQVPSPVQAGTSSSSRFATVSDSEMQSLRKCSVPENTQKNTNFAVNVWKEWNAHRKKVSPGDWPAHLLLMSEWEMNRWLSRFVVEIRRRDGKEYPPNSLHGICCGLLRYIRGVKPELDIFRDAAFASFRQTLDAEMKRLKSNGLGDTIKRAEPITVDEEELLWTKNLLGDHSPQALVDTLLYLCGTCFALRSVQEHRELRLSSFELVERAGETPYLVYRESVSKNHPGGLKNRHDKPKVVIHHANKERPDRCLIQFYKKYLEHRPSSVDVFYLTPIPHPKTKIWYKTTPIGENTLGKTVKRLCAAAGIKGYKTNHSLRVTAATRLFHEGIDEQLIMERTGHKSLDGVRTYKRSSEKQQEVLSSVLNNAPSAKKPKVDQDPLLKEKSHTTERVSEANVKSGKVHNVQEATVNVHGVQVHDINVQGFKENFPVLNLSGCSNVSVNYYLK